MTKDTFLTEMNKISKHVSLFKVSQAIGRHYNTVRNYCSGQGADVDIMNDILNESKGR